MSTQKRNRQRGKEHQKRTAKALNGMNIGTLGGEDVLHPLFSIECKSAKRFVGSKWMEQCEKNNSRKVTPLVIVHITGKHSDNDFVMIKLKDFKKILNEKNNLK